MRKWIEINSILIFQPFFINQIRQGENIKNVINGHWIHFTKGILDIHEIEKVNFLMMNNRSLRKYFSLSPKLKEKNHFWRWATVWLGALNPKRVQIISKAITIAHLLFLLISSGKQDLSLFISTKAKEIRFSERIDVMLDAFLFYNKWYLLSNWENHVNFIEKCGPNTFFIFNLVLKKMLYLCYFDYLYTYNDDTFKK